MAAKSKKTQPQQDEFKINSVIARTDDGTVQLTLTIPQTIASKIKELVIKRMIDDLTVPGFRKGKAPTDIALKHVDTQKVYDHTLQTLLPEAYSQAVVQHNLQPVLSPRFELLSVSDDKDWEVRAITCEAPEVNLGDYKTKISDLKKSDIWVPGKDQEKKEPTSEEKEQQIIKTILESAEAKIPTILVEEEVNHRLAQLLDQVQRLGMTIEQYLSSTGRNVEQLKQEYSAQAKDSIKLVLALNKVAQEEKVEVADSEIDSVLSAGQTAAGDEALEKGSPHELEQKRLIRSVLLRRKALDKLASLI